MICVFCKGDNQYFKIEYIDKKIPILFGEIHFKGYCCKLCLGDFEYFKKQYLGLNNHIIQENKEIKEQDAEYVRDLETKEKGALRD